jgi:hypothetical protein
MIRVKIKQTFVFIIGLFISTLLYSQTGNYDSIVINGRIIKSKILQKDWNSRYGNSGNKTYQLYWLEFTLQTDSVTIQPAGINIKLPGTLFFKTPSSGLLSELQPYHEIKAKDFVTITFQQQYLEQFIRKESEAILISKIKLLT